MGTPDDLFVAKTHAELAIILAELRVARRNRPAHAWCPDNSGCRHCCTIRDLHQRINDHLLQLEGKDPDPYTEPLKLALAFHAPGATGNPAATNCGICRRHRFANQRGARICIECDYPAYTADALDMDDAE